MPSRRPHSKSRNGCVQCKKSHVKCDVASPICGYCTRRGWPCSFLTRQIDSPATSSATQRSPAVSEPRPVTNGLDWIQIKRDASLASHNRTRELDLMHSYSTNTWITICGRSRDIEIWRTAAPREAFEHDFLLDAILGITALHRAFERVDQKSYWAEIALEYQNRALSRFNLLISNITPHTCHAAFAFAVINLFMTVALPPAEPTDPILHTLTPRHHIQGILAVALQCEAELRRGAFGVFFLPTGPSYHTVAPEHEARLRLAELYTISEDTPDRKSYHTAIDGILQFFNQGLLSLITWTMFSLDDRFVSLLQARDPMAILIALHYAAGLHFLNHKWFVGRLGQQLIQELCTLLPSPAPSPAFAASVEWTRVHVGLDKNPLTPDYLSTPSAGWPVTHFGFDQGSLPSNPSVSTPRSISD